MGRIKNESLWKAKIGVGKHKQLKKEEETDIAVIGAGLAGTITAYLLNKEGFNVTLLEKDTIGASAATAYTSAFITQVLDTSLDELAKMFSEKTAREAWDSHMDAINALEKIVRTEKIDCDFMRCSAYEYANDENELKLLKKKYTFAEKLGFDVEMTERDNLYFPQKGHLEWKRQAKFDPGKFLSALAEIAAGNGVRIFEKSEATKIIGKGPFNISTKKGNLKANRVVITTYYPLGNPKVTSFKKGMYRSYIFEAKLKPTRLREAIYMDQNNPYHYFRIDRMKDCDRLIIGGEDHRDELKMNPLKNFAALSEYLESILPGIEYEIIRKWDGPIIEPSDGLGIIGEYKKDSYLGTAFSGNGMTYSMLTGMIVRDLIKNENNEWTYLYDPKRKMSIRALASKAVDYTKEFLGGAAKNMARGKKIINGHR